MSEPSTWVLRYIGGVAPGSRVLDVACGQGRHIGLCRAHGLHVTGIDRDIGEATRVHGGDTGVTLVRHDLEDGSPFPSSSGNFGGVIVTNYLWRPILPAIVGAVGLQGMLIYETFRLGNERFGKPSRPDFLLRPGELLAAVAGKLTVIAFEDATLAETPRVVQRICAVGAQHPWIDQPPPSSDSRSPKGGRPS